MAAAAAPARPRRFRLPAIPVGWNRGIDHQRPGDCAHGHPMPLPGIATVPEDPPDALRVMLVLAS